LKVVRVGNNDCLKRAGGRCKPVHHYLPNYPTEAEQQKVVPVITVMIMKGRGDPCSS